MSFLGKLFQRAANAARRRSSLYLNRRMVDLKPGTPIISFTFDDFPKTASDAGRSLLETHGARGTYYAALGLMDRRESPVGPIFSAQDLLSVHGAGHELGCHTFNHCNAWTTPADVFEEEIRRNGEAIRALVPGLEFKTHSYPIAYPSPSNKRVISRHFTAARGGGQSFNLGPTDLNNFKAFFLEQGRDRPELIDQLIDQNARAGGWLVFATHDVSDQPTRFGVTPDLFERVVDRSKKSSSLILPVGEALARMLPSR